MSTATRNVNLTNTHNSLSDVTSIETIQSENWLGALPIQLTLAITSVSTPTPPHPIHVPVPRHSYLHVALRSAILRLHQYAPVPILFETGANYDEPATITRTEPEPECENDKDIHHITQDAINKDDLEHGRQSIPKNTSSSRNKNPVDDSLPICWFEDEETRTALRWQMFAGVIFDVLHGRKKRHTTLSSLPWRIRLHFANYPTNQILPLQDGAVLTQIRHFYQNSIKQSLSLQTGTSKAALNLTRESHGLLWDSIQTGNYKVYRQCDICDFTKKRLDNIIRIPIRLYVDTEPPIQPSCRINSNNDKQLTLGDVLVRWVSEYFEKVIITINTIHNNNESKSNDNENENDNKTDSTKISFRPKDSATTWRVSGMEVPLDIPVFDLWKQLCHPDQFLYIIVVTN